MSSAPHSSYIQTSMLFSVYAQHTLEVAQLQLALRMSRQATEMFRTASIHDWLSSFSRAYRNPAKII